MKNAIILHGSPFKDQYDNPDFPSTSNYYWLPWAQKQLSIHKIYANTPEVPEAWNPHYQTWKKAFEHYEVTADTVLIGHSCGAGFLVRWLSENKSITTNKVLLVAPWLDLANDPDNADTQDFFNFEIDPYLADRTKDLVIINSDNDKETIQYSVKRIKESIKNVRYVELHNRGHFYDDKNMEFPELIEEILR